MVRKLAFSGSANLSRGQCPLQSILDGNPHKLSGEVLGEGLEPPAITEEETNTYLMFLSLSFCPQSQLTG